jgi:HSP20 family molecular chaperone IbpA
MENESKFTWPVPVDECAPEPEETASLQSDINRYYHRTMGQAPVEAPIFSFWFGRRRLLVAAQVHDVLSDSIEVVLQEQHLWVRGTLRQAGRPCGNVWLQGSPLRFARCIELPYAVDTATLKATWISGVLLIHGFRQAAGQQAA